MARYQILSAGGVHDTQAPAHDVTPANYTEWAAYLAWLAAGNASDAAAPPADPYPTLAMQRTEVLARLDALLDEKRRHATFTAAGHTWKLTAGFLALLSISLATTPPLPGGFVLPDASRVQVPLGAAQLRQVGDGARDALLAIGAAYAALVIIVNASATPLTVDISAGWP